MDKVLFLFWFFLPAGLANSTPVLAMKVPWLKKLSYPMDFYMKIGKKRILGSHKTLRGLLLGIVTGITIVAIQKYLYVNYDFVKELSEIDYTGVSSLALGGLFGFGGIMGDATKSFFKRRVGIKPGGPWIPFDQIDFIIGGILFSCLYVQLSLFDYVGIFFIYLFLHFFTNVIAFSLKLKDVPY